MFFTALQLCGVAFIIWLGIIGIFFLFMGFATMFAAPIFLTVNLILGIIQIILPKKESL